MKGTRFNFTMVAIFGPRRQAKIEGEGLWKCFL